MANGKRIILDLLHRKWLIFVFFIILVAISKGPFLNLPLFWDEPSYMENSLLVLKNNFNPFVAGAPVYRPPLLSILTALIYKIFGFSMVSTHLLIAVFSFIAVWFTFLIGEKLYDRETGFWAGLLLFSSPVFFAQSGLFLESVPVTALCASAVYFFIKDRKLMYIISAALLIMVREVGVVVIMAIASYAFLASAAKIIFSPDKTPLFLKIKRAGLKTLFYVSPLVFFVLWMIYNKLFLGWFLLPSNAVIFEKIGFSLVDLRNISYYAFWIHFRCLISISIISGVLFSLFNSKFRAKFLKNGFWFFIFLTSVVILFYMWIEFARDSLGTFSVLPRYYLFLQVLFFVFGAAAIKCMFTNKIMRTVIFTVVIGLFVKCWFEQDFIWAGEQNLFYRTTVETHRKTAEFLEKNYPSAIILTSWPVCNELTIPEQGYVRKAFDKTRVINLLFANPGIDELVKRFRQENPQEVILLVVPEGGLVNDEMKDFMFLPRENRRLLTIISTGINKVWIYLL